MSEVLTPTRLGGLRLTKAKDQAAKTNMLIYGDPGVGKTRLLGSSDAVPEMRKVLEIDINGDGGGLTLRDTFPNVDVVQVTKFVQLQNVYNALFAGGHGYNTVCIDTLTELQKLNMTDVMKDLVARDPARNEYVPDRREWGISSEMVRRLIHAFKNLPVHTIFTAHVKEDEDQSTGIIVKRPDLPGKLARQVSGFFDLVLYMYAKEVRIEVKDEPKLVEKRLILSKGTSGKITAKDRFNRLPKIWEVPENEPAMPKMYQLIHGAKQ